MSSTTRSTRRSGCRSSGGGGGGGSMNLNHHSKPPKLTELNAALLSPYSVDKIESIIRKNPEQVRVDNHKIWPLHLACNSKQPATNIIKLLVDLYPEGVSCQDPAGFTPLHYACQNAAISVEVISLLIDTNPECVRQKNSAGWLPLFLACGRSSISSAVIELLVERYPAALSEAFGGAEMLALHWACSQRAPLPVVQALFEGYPDAVETKTKSGMLPLHWACACGAELPVVIFLTLENPSSLTEADESGLLPLHLACHKQDALPVVQWLVARAPASVHVRACNGHLPLDSCKAGQAKASKPVRDFVEYATEHMDPAMLSSRDVLIQAIAIYRDASAPSNARAGGNSKHSQQEACKHLQFLEPLVDLVAEVAHPVITFDCEEAKLVTSKVENSYSFGHDSLKAAAAILLDHAGDP